MDNWKPKSKRTSEDKILLSYWQTFGGLIFTEVIVGRGGNFNWPANSKPRRIDAVRILSSKQNEIITFNKKVHAKEFENLLENAEIEIIEIKGWLDRFLLGQVIIGADLLEIEYKPNKITQVVLFPANESDPVLETICKKRKIKYWSPK